MLCPPTACSQVAPEAEIPGSVSNDGAIGTSATANDPNVALVDAALSELGPEEGKKKVRKVKKKAKEGA